MQGPKVVRAGIVLALVLLVGLVSSCGSDEISSGDVVAGVASGPDVATTMRSLSSLRVAALDSKGDPTTEGTFDQAGRRARVEEHRASGERDLVTVGDQAWATWPGSATAACRGWSPVAIGAGASGLLSSNDTEVWWLILDETTSSVGRGTDEEGDETLTGFGATFDLSAVVTRSAKDASSAAAELDVLVAKVAKLRPLEGAPTSIPIDYWLDDEGRVARMRISVSPTGTAAGSHPSSVELVDVAFSDFDAPVDVRAPDASQVHDVHPGACP